MSTDSPFSEALRLGPGILSEFEFWAGQNVFVSRYPKGMCWCKAVIGDAAASSWPQNIKLLPSWGSENHQDIITIFWRRKDYDVVLLRHETETISIVVQCVKYALLILLPKACLHWSQATGHPVLLQLPPRKATIIMWILNLVESISGNSKSLKMDVG